MSNIATKSFNKEFCLQLQVRLSNTLLNFAKNKFERYWCDGVNMPFVDERLTKASINTTKEIVTSAWILLNRGGDREYYMIIKLGPLALERCNQDLPLTDCLPPDDTIDWIAIDIENGTIELKLY